jgi:perosamine synthetase
LPGFIANKRNLAARYVKAFAGVPGASIFVDADYAESNYWLVTMMLDESDETVRDRFLQACHDRDIFCRPTWKGMHTLPMYANCPRMDLSQAEALEGRIVNLPSSAILGRT